MSEKTRVKTGETRLSYCHIWEPTKNQNGAEVYSTMILIPKSDVDTLNAIESAVEMAYEEGKDKLKGSSSKVPALGAIRTPVRDGDEEYPDKPEMAGMFFINASNKRKPSIVDAENNIIMDTEEIYSGVWCQCSIEFFAYNAKGNKGITTSLRAIKKVRDDECLGRSLTDTSHDFD